MACGLVKSKAFSRAHNDDGGGGGEGFENIQIQTHRCHMALSWSERHVLLVTEAFVNTADICIPPKSGSFA